MANLLKFLKSRNYICYLVTPHNKLPEKAIMQTNGIFDEEGYVVTKLVYSPSSTETGTPHRIPVSKLSPPISEEEISVQKFPTLLKRNMEEREYSRSLLLKETYYAPSELLKITLGLTNRSWSIYNDGSKYYLGVNQISKKFTKRSKINNKMQIIALKEAFKGNDILVSSSKETKKVIPGVAFYRLYI